MAVQPAECSQSRDAHARGLASAIRGSPKADELNVDVRGEGPRQLDRVSFAAAEEPIRAEGCRRNVNHPHLRVVLITLGDPTQLTGGYLFHQRLAELAPRHNAELHFASFPPRPFPLSIL